MATLEELLNSDPKASPAPSADIEQPAPPEHEAEVEATQEKTEEFATGDTGAKETPEQAAPPAAAEEPLDKRISAFQRKAEDETRKRQDIEKQHAEMKRQLEEQARYIEQVRQWQTQQQQTDPEVDLLDPRQQQAFISRQLSGSLYETKVVLSQEMMRAAHPDYDAMEEIFATHAERDPSLIVQLHASPVPAKFAYETGKRLKLMQELSDPDAYRARLREEILAELKSAEPPASQSVQTPKAPAPQPPSSLAGVTSAPRNPVKHSWKGPTPLHELLG